MTIQCLQKAASCSLNPVSDGLVAPKSEADIYLVDNCVQLESYADFRQVDVGVRFELDADFHIVYNLETGGK